MIDKILYLWKTNKIEMTDKIKKTTGGVSHLSLSIQNPHEYYSHHYHKPKLLELQPRLAIVWGPHLVDLQLDMQDISYNSY